MDEVELKAVQQVRSWVSLKSRSFEEPPRRLFAPPLLEEAAILAHIHCNEFTANRDVIISNKY